MVYVCHVRRTPAPAWDHQALIDAATRAGHVHTRGPNRRGNVHVRQVAQHLGISPSSASLLLAGRTTPSHTTVDAIERVYGLSYDRLRRGPQ